MSADTQDRDVEPSVLREQWVEGPADPRQAAPSAPFGLVALERPTHTRAAVRRQHCRHVRVQAGPRHALAVRGRDEAVREPDHLVGDESSDDQSAGMCSGGHRRGGHYLQVLHTPDRPLQVLDRSQFGHGGQFA